MQDAACRDQNMSRGSKRRPAAETEQEITGSTVTMAMALLRVAAHTCKESGQFSAVPGGSA
jgi:hypothetical protein